MTDLSCLVYVLAEGTVAWYLEKYLFHVVIISLTLSAILVFFIVPLTILFFIYLSNILLLIYRRNSEVKANPLSDVWNSARRAIASFWDIYARVWHGYELHGVENLPEGPGIVVYYHGAIPIDCLYFMSRLFLWKKRLCLSVADHFVFRLPGLKLLLEVTGVMPGTREECLIALKNGHLVSISPGGVREALFSDENYQLVWGNRKDFAQVALDAKVHSTSLSMTFISIGIYVSNGLSVYQCPVTPVMMKSTDYYSQLLFHMGTNDTANWNLGRITEDYKALGVQMKDTEFFRQLYESTRLPVTPPYGGLPVKLRTYIGEPIPYDPNITAEELVEKTKTAIQALISKHQTIPGSIWKALLERFDKRHKSD